MESSQVAGEMEECNSSESGWTKYIASPMKSVNDDYSDEDQNNYEDDDNGDDDDDDDTDTSESEDSMASDASSGPAHLDTTSSSNANNVMRGPKPDEDDEEGNNGTDADEEDVGKLPKTCNRGRGRAAGGNKLIRGTSSLHSCLSQPERG